MTVSDHRCYQHSIMNKVKSTFAGGSSKITKAFKRDDGPALQKLSNAVTEDGVREFSRASLPKTHIILHALVLFFTFLSICTMAAVAAFQAKWFKVSGGVGFSLFLLLFSFLLSAALLAIPLIYDRWDKGRRPAQFLSQARSTFILHAFGALLMIMVCFIVTVSAWGAKGCKNPDDDPHAELGDDFKNGLKGWCRTKRASSIFDWLAWASWCGLVVLSGIVFRNERRNVREAPFIPPASPTGSAFRRNSGPGAYAQVEEDDNVFADKHEAYGAPTQPAPYGYSRPIAHAPVSAMARPSVDAYGAFDGDMPGAVQGSRTMQMAYSDPYANVRASVIGDAYAQPAPYRNSQQYGRPPAY